MMCDLMGQVAWVTGAGSGIGQDAGVTLAKSPGRALLERTADLVRAAGAQALIAFAA